jgi:hypothetical protein
MQKISKLLIAYLPYLGLIALAVLLSALTVQAADPAPVNVPNLNIGGGVSPVDTPKVVGNVAATIFNVIYFLAGLAAVAYVVWGGIKYIQAGGDPKKAEEARKAIINAVIGIAVIAGSYFIISLALGLGKDVNKITAGPMYTGLTQ